MTLKEKLESVNKTLKERWERDKISSKHNVSTMMDIYSPYGERGVMTIKHIARIKPRLKKRNVKYAKYGEPAMTIYSVELVYLHEDANDSMTLEELKDMSEDIQNGYDCKEHKRQLEVLEKYKEMLDKSGISHNEIYWLMREVNSLPYEMTKDL